MDWTPCGNGKVCLDHQCVAHTFNSTCSSSCPQNAACTNKGKCVCNYGWTGENCETIDPDPPKTTETPFVNNNDNAENNSMMLVSMVTLVYCATVTQILFLLF